jgi:hypothetical protein
MKANHGDGPQEFDEFIKPLAVWDFRESWAVYVKEFTLQTDEGPRPYGSMYVINKKTGECGDLNAG